MDMGLEALGLALRWECLSQIKPGVWSMVIYIHTSIPAHFGEPQTARLHPLNALVDVG